MGWKSFNPLNPRIGMRGYHDSLYDQVQLNPSIYRWDSPTFPYDPLSVSTDYLVPHVEAWDYSDYSDLFDNRIQLNLPIYRWEYATYTHSPLSVSTDYYLRLDYVDEK
jgi:hypothetical protein